MHDKVALANDIDKFFVRKIDRIRSDIEAMDLDQSAVMQFLMTWK